MKHVYIFAALATLATGCAYTEGGFSDLLDEQTLGGLGFSRAGYSATPLASDAYRIHAFGNMNASHKKTNAVALVRAAMLAEEHGYERFVIIDYNEWTQTSYRRTPTTATTDTKTTANFSAYGTAYNVGSDRYASVYGRGNAQSTSTTTIYHGQTYAINKPKTDIVVLFVPDNAPEAARALRVADIIGRYGKIAGYKPKETSALAQTVPVMSTNAAPPSAAGAETEVATDYVAANAATRASAQTFSGSHLPTLDEVYKSLSASEKARVNRLPPAQRAGYLEEIRGNRF